MPDRPDLFMTVYLALAIVGGLLTMSTIKMIRDSRFLDLREPLWLNLCRCCALIVMGFGMMLAARWHVDTGRSPWASEMFVVTGIDFYLGAAVLSSYLRTRGVLRRLPSKV